MSNPKVQGKNQFGEEIVLTLLQTPSSLQSLSTTLPAKAGVTAIAALATPITAVTIALSTSNTYTDAAVNTAVNAALVTVVADMQAQLTKINAILAALKATT